VAIPRPLYSNTYSSLPHQQITPLFLLPSIRPTLSTLSATRRLGQLGKSLRGASSRKILGLAGSPQDSKAVAFLGLFLAATALRCIVEAYTDVKGASGCTHRRRVGFLCMTPDRTLGKKNGGDS
jgi:hypothetical protein